VKGAVFQASGVAAHTAAQAAFRIDLAAATRASSACRQAKCNSSSAASPSTNCSTTSMARRLRSSVSWFQNCRAHAQANKRIFRSLARP
jgi:hypothetical protein